MQIEQGFNRYNTVSRRYYVRAAVYFPDLQMSHWVGFQNPTHHLQNMIQVALFHQVTLVHHNQICHPNLQSGVRRTAFAGMITPVSANRLAPLRHLDLHLPSFESDNSWSPPQSPHHPSRPLEARRGDTKLMQKSVTQKTKWDNTGFMEGLCEFNDLENR